MNTHVQSPISSARILLPSWSLTNMGEQISLLFWHFQGLGPSQLECPPFLPMLWREQWRKQWRKQWRAMVRAKALDSEVTVIVTSGLSQTQDQPSFGIWGQQWWFFHFDLLSTRQQADQRCQGLYSTRLPSDFHRDVQAQRTAGHPPCEPTEPSTAPYQLERDHDSTLGSSTLAL